MGRRESFSVGDLQAALGDYTCLVRSFSFWRKEEYLTILGQRLIGDCGCTEILAPLLHVKVVWQFLTTLLPKSG